MVKKAVILAAGWGTRILPFTKSQPKEMLPLVDKPAIQFIVEELAASGIKNILIITNRDKKSVEDHFDNHFELEATLEKRGKQKELEEVRKPSTLDLHIHFLRQKEQLGTGHALLLAKSFVGDEDFLFVLGDSFLEGEPAAKQLLDAYQKVKAPVFGLFEVPKEKVSRFGVVKVENQDNGLLLIQDFVEKPKQEEAPSNLAIEGRYILTPKIFSLLEQIPRSANGELETTTAFREMVKTDKMFGCVFKARRFDVGNRLDYAKAFLYHALSREDIGEELREYVKELF